jgi:hypothetical protein
VVTLNLRQRGAGEGKCVEQAMRTKQKPLNGRGVFLPATLHRWGSPGLFTLSSSIPLQYFLSLSSFMMFNSPPLFFPFYLLVQFPLSFHPSPSKGTTSPYPEREGQRKVKNN